MKHSWYATIIMNSIKKKFIYSDKMQYNERSTAYF